MSEPAIQALEQRLENVLGQLKTTKDPALRRTLLVEMRGLIAELERLVLESTRSYSAQPDPK